MKKSSWRRRTDAGQRLLPQVIDDLAIDEPNRILFEEANGTTVSEGFRKTTCRAYANAINKTAWWLEKTLGGRSTNFETIGYLGPGDSRYLILVVAAIKAGFKMLYVSPRNSLEGHLAVIKASNCKIWLRPSEDNRTIDHVLKSCRNMRIYSFPELDDLYTPEMVEQYPYIRTWDEGRTDAGWVLHTSGSTGLPKPIIKTLQSASITETHRLCEPVNGRPILLNDMIGARIYVTLPSFHSLGLNTTLHWPIFYDQTIILGPLVPVTVDIMAEMISQTNPDALVTSPSLLEAWSETGNEFTALSKLKAVAFGGGPLSQSVGDSIASKTHLITILGATESGWLTAVETDPEDWNYLHFHPNAGLELRPHSAGLFELVAVRDPKLELWQTIFSTFPNLQEYAFKDLFSPHPTKKDLWHHEGRADNIIILSSGEKFNPDRLEQAITEHPLVRTILVAGYGRFQTSAIVELTEEAQRSGKNEAEIIAEIWPAVVAANKLVDAHGRLQKAFIMIASPQKPFLRASKGTVQKSQTLELYADLLEELYAEELQEHDAPQIDVSTPVALQKGISQAVRLISGCPDLGNNEDIFDGSFDSLQVLTLLRQLKSDLREAFSAIGLDSGQLLTAAIIYANPTATLLFEAIQSLLVFPTTLLSEATPSTITNIQVMLDRYTPNIPERTESIMIPSPVDKTIVLLTGSTGSLGSYILEALIQSVAVGEIWCFNRSEDAEERQKKSNCERGLTTEWKSCSVHFLLGDLCKPNFGLAQDTYELLRGKVTHIIHNAWRVDFNLTLSSFEPQIAGTSRLVEFSSSITHEVSLLYVSSIGAVQNWQSPDPILEISITDLALASRGYGQSKLITERLIMEAPTSDLLKAKICRVGQVAGPVGYGIKGKWNKKEWLPTIIEASAYMGLVPVTLGNVSTIDWIPVDIMGSILVEIALQRPGPGQQKCVYHGVNAHSCSWSTTLLSAIQNHLPHLSPVSWKDWMSALSEAIDSSNDPNKVPGVKLMDFFTGIGKKLRSSPIFDTTEIRKSSRTFRELKAVNEDWMELWMKQWGY